MQRYFKRTACTLLAVLFLFTGALSVQAAAPAAASAEKQTDAKKEGTSADAPVAVKAKSCILMSADTGEVLYKNNEHEKLNPASVTKIMSLLLIMEALEDNTIHYDDKVVCSENASKKGGSQIWLKQGEEMTVDELLKAIAVASANDACCAMAEYIGGSEEGFVKMMNTRAKELGMNDTNFENCSGLDDTATNHVTCSYDIAVMSRELLKHEKITKYTTIWMDTLRGGKTELTNTNKLIRFYKGATGLKTGTTSKAGSCLSASAKRDGMQLIAVVMGCTTSNDRFDSAKALLNYGFANWSLVTPKVDEKQLHPVKVLGGMKQEIQPQCGAPQPILLEKGKDKQLEQKVDLPEDVQAAVEKGQALGTVSFLLNGKTVQEIKLTAPEKVEKMTFAKALLQLLKTVVA